MYQFFNTFPKIKFILYNSYTCSKSDLWENCSVSILNIFQKPNSYRYTLDIHVYMYKTEDWCCLKLQTRLLLYGTSHFKAPVSGRSGKVPLSADKWSLRRDVTGFWRLFFFPEGLRLVQCLYFYPQTVFVLVLRYFFFCSSNFGIIYQRIYMYAPLNTNDF